MASIVKSKVLKKKKWYSILAPALFNNVELGETYAENIEGAKGKRLSLNLYSLTGDPKKQNTNISFVVYDVKENKAFTEVDSYFLSHTFTRKSVRPGKDKIEDSFVCETADKIKVRVKVFLLSSKKITNSVKAAMIKNLRMFLLKEVSGNPFEKNMEEIISSRLQKSLKVFLKKIYPLSICEIRVFEKAT